jgi:hypothetical protein
MAIDATSSGLITESRFIQPEDSCNWVTVALVFILPGQITVTFIPSPLSSLLRLFEKE